MLVGPMPDLELKNCAGERLDHVLTPGRGDGRELVIVAHGVTSCHDRPYLNDICEALAEEGIASLRFSFSGNGNSEGRFEDSSISKEVADLLSVIDALSGWTLAYVGHSMGGAAGVLCAAQDERLSALVSLAGMTEVRAFMDRHFGHLTPEEDCMFEREHARLTTQFLEDARRIGSTLPQARRISIPWLLVHGTDDELVPFGDSVLCADACPEHATLTPVTGADHCFTDRHGDLIRSVVPWLVRALRHPTEG